MAKINVVPVTMTNLQAIAARTAINRLGESNGRNREIAERFARIGIMLDGHLRLYEVTRRNLIKSNVLTDSEGNTLFHDAHGQTPRLRWGTEDDVAALDNDRVTLRLEKLTISDLGDNPNSNTLIALAPLLADFELPGDEA